MAKEGGFNDSAMGWSCVVPEGNGGMRMRKEEIHLHAYFIRKWKRMTKIFGFASMRKGKHQPGKHDLEVRMGAAPSGTAIFTKKDTRGAFL